MSKMQVMIMSAGGMGSLVAAGAIASQAEPPAMTFVYFSNNHPADGARATYAARQAANFDARFLEIESGQVDSAQIGLAKLSYERVGPVSQSRARLLLCASGIARRLGAARLIWPAQFNADFDQISIATEQAIVAQQLAQIEDEDHVPIETPIMDLTDRQIVELGSHLNVPWESSWSCTQQGDSLCQTCDCCNRRWAAFDEAGIVDPTRSSVQLAGAR